MLFQALNQVTRSVPFHTKTLENIDILSQKNRNNDIHKLQSSSVTFENTIITVMQHKKYEIPFTYNYYRAFLKYNSDFYSNMSTNIVCLKAI